MLRPYGWCVGSRGVGADPCRWHVDGHNGAMDADVGAAFDTVDFMRGPSMPNRFMLAPLTNQQSNDDGTLSDDEYRWLTMRAAGGFGLTMTCAAHVQEIGRGFAGQLGCFGDQHLDGLRRLAEGINAHGGVSAAQLHHAGNRSPADLIGTAPVCPSDDPATGARGLTTGEVEQVRDDFIAAAQRCERAGFHGVELHGAHGYLLCQFLSAELNHRTDQYGGSPDNRARLLFEIIDGIRATCSPDLHLAVRLSPERFGMRLDEIVDVFTRLVDTGDVDMIDMSLWDSFKEPVDEAHAGTRLIDHFTAIDRGRVRLGVAGKLRTPADVASVLDAGADIAIIGRTAIFHHDYPQRVAADPTWQPLRPPIPVSTLRDEGLSDSFIGYMRNWENFVADG